MSLPSPNTDHRGGHALGIGQILGDAFTTSLRSYPGIFFLNLPILIASVAAFGSSAMSSAPADQAAMQALMRDNPARFVLMEIVVLLIAIVASCAMTRLIYDRYVGAPVSGTASATDGAKRTLPVLGLMLIIGLVCAVVAVVLALIFALLQAVVGTLAVLLGLAAATFCLYLAFPYVLANAVCVIEELGPIASLARSKFLTDGYRWPILGLFVIFTLVMLVYQGVVFGLGYLLAPAAFGGTILLVLVALAYPLLGGWMIGLFVIAAHRLRALKDGITPSRTLSNVFE